MSEVTLQAVQAKQAELASMIAQLVASAATSIALPELVIDLRPGERYAGAILNEDGTVAHHTILMASEPDGRLTWQDAMAWASDVGGELPSRREQALLFANLREQFQSAWYWSSEAHANDASYAWRQYFGYGTQDYDPKSYEVLARAVRRLPA